MLYLVCMVASVFQW